MTDRIITDISNFIFVSDEPQKAGAIFLPGGPHPEQPEYAAKLYHKGLAKWMVPSGGVSVKRAQWPGVKAKAEIYNAVHRRPFVKKRPDDPYHLEEIFKSCGEAVQYVGVKDHKRRPDERRDRSSSI